MLHTLQVALTGVVTEERLDVLLESTRLLQASGLSAPLDELQEVLEIQNSLADNALLVSRLTDILHLALRQVLLELGVRCTDTVELVELNAVLLTVSLLEQYLIPEHLIGLMGGDFNEEEVIAHMVPVFTTLTEDEALHALVEVDPALLLRLRDLMTAQLQLRGMSDAELLPDNTARLAAINRLITAVGVERVGVVYELANAGIRAGRPLSALLAQSTETLDTLPPERAVSELLALVFFSNHPLEEVMGKTLELIMDYTDQPYQQQLMEKTLKDLLMKVGR